MYSWLVRNRSGLRVAPSFAAAGDEVADTVDQAQPRREDLAGQRGTRGVGVGASGCGLLRHADFLPQKIQNFRPASRAELNEQIALLVLNVGADLGAELDEQVDELGVVPSHPLKVFEKPLDSAVVVDLLVGQRLPAWDVLSHRRIQVLFLCDCVPYQFNGQLVEEPSAF